MKNGDPLWPMNFLINRYIANRGTAHQFICCVTPDVHGDDAEIRKSEVGLAWLELVKLSVSLDELVKAVRHNRRLTEKFASYGSPDIYIKWEKSETRLLKALSRLGAE